MASEALQEDQQAEDDPILKYKEAAKFLGRAYQTLANLRYRGEGPVQDGAGYRRSALIRWRDEEAEKRRLREEARRHARQNKNQPTLFDYLRREHDRRRDAPTD